MDLTLNQICWFELLKMNVNVLIQRNELHINLFLRLLIFKTWFNKISKLKEEILNLQLYGKKKIKKNPDFLKKYHKDNLAQSQPVN